MKTNQQFFSLSMLVLLLGLLLPSNAGAADWTIVRMSGDVRIFHNNVTWVALTANRELKPGDAIWTGHNGRVMLSYEEGQVILKPRSMVKIPAQRLPGQNTVLFQSMGSLDADIEKRDKSHFSIHTPYLAAVVKGTKFSVTVDEKLSLLQVTEGIVEAIDKQSGAIVNVLAGQYVAAVHGGSGGLYGTAEGSQSPASLGPAGLPGALNGIGPDSSDGGSSAGNGGGNNDSAEEQRAHSDNRDKGKGKKVGHSR